MPKAVLKVVGVSFSNTEGPKKVGRQTLLKILYDDYWTEDRRGEIVLNLVPEDDNEYDPNAVGIYCIEPAEAAGRLGFFAREEAPKVRRLIDGGRLTSVVVDKMIVGSGGRVALCVALHVSAKPKVVTDEEGRTYEMR